jgi:hypothetical protein
VSVVRPGRRRIGYAIPVSHAEQHITDPGVFRLSVSTGEGYVVFGWDYPGATLLEIRIVRSTEGFAKDRDDPARPVGQRIVFQGIGASFRDTDVELGTTYFYTVYARRRDDLEWTRWSRHRVVAGRPYRPGLTSRSLARLRRLLPVGLL